MKLSLRILLWTVLSTSFASKQYVDDEENCINSLKTMCPNRNITSVFGNSTMECFRTIESNSKLELSCFYYTSSYLVAIIPECSYDISHICTHEKSNPVQLLKCISRAFYFNSVGAVCQSKINALIGGDKPCTNDAIKYCPAESTLSSSLACLVERKVGSETLLPTLTPSAAPTTATTTQPTALRTASPTLSTTTSPTFLPTSQSSTSPTAALSNLAPSVPSARRLDTTSFELEPSCAGIIAQRINCTSSADGSFRLPCWDKKPLEAAVEQEEYTTRQKAKKTNVILGMLLALVIVIWVSVQCNTASSAITFSVSQLREFCTDFAHQIRDLVRQLMGHERSIRVSSGGTPSERRRSAAEFKNVKYHPAGVADDQEQDEKAAHEGDIEMMLREGATGVLSAAYEKPHSVSTVKRAPVPVKTAANKVSPPIRQHNNQDMRKASEYNDLYYDTLPDVPDVPDVVEEEVVPGEAELDAELFGDDDDEELGLQSDADGPPPSRQF